MASSTLLVDTEAAPSAPMVRPGGEFDYFFATAARRDSVLFAAGLVDAGLSQAFVPTTRRRTNLLRVS